MSQVLFKAKTKDGIPVEVMGGWDKPLRYYHFTIFDRRPESEDEPLYDCLSEDTRQFTTNERHKATLIRFGIEAPPGFWERADQRVGNVMHTFKDGSWEVLD